MGITTDNQEEQTFECIEPVFPLSRSEIPIESSANSAINPTFQAI